MRPVFKLFFLVLLAIQVAGCANFRTERNYAVPRTLDPGKTSTWTMYIPNRIFDFGDIFAADMMFGKGTNIRFHATKAIKVVYPETTSGLAVGWNTHWKDPIQDGKSNYLLNRYMPAKLGCMGGKDLRMAKNPADPAEIYQSPDTCGFGFQLFVFGMDFGFRPVEAADFITGFGLLDLNRDDLLYVPSI